MREATFGQSDDFSWRVVAHDIQMMFQRRVFGSLEINQLCCLVHPNLRTRGVLQEKKTKKIKDHKKNILYLAKSSPQRLDTDHYCKSI